MIFARLIVLMSFKMPKPQRPAENDFEIVAEALTKSSLGLVSLSSQPLYSGSEYDRAPSQPSCTPSIDFVLTNIVQVNISDEAI